MVDEAADVVDVAVGVVADGAGDEPEDVADAEILLEGVVDFQPAQAGIADLDAGIEVAFFGGQ